jgi:hypothetical protein
MRTGSTAAIGTCSVPSVNEPVVHTFGTLGTSVVITGLALLLVVTTLRTMTGPSVVAVGGAMI